jgi:hypothetical protein
VLSSCASACGRTRWQADGIFRPPERTHAPTWDHVDLHVRGSRPAGADLGDECDGTLSIVDNTGSRIEIAAGGAALEPLVRATVPAGLLAPGTPLRHEALVKVSHELSPAEAAALIRMFLGACAGPKEGFPTAPEIVADSTSQRYL